MTGELNKGVTWSEDIRNAGHTHARAHTHTHRQKWLTAALKEFPAAEGLVHRDRPVTTASPTATRTTNRKATSQALLSRTFPFLFFLSFFIYHYSLFSFSFISFFPPFLSPTNSYCNRQSWASHHGDLGSTSRHSTWDLLWTTRQPQRAIINFFHLPKMLYNPSN
jgi:hypothetical protein